MEKYWIELTKENTPKEDVLCINHHGEYLLGWIHFNDDEGCFECENDHELLTKVSHYMYIKPPKRESEDCFIRSVVSETIYHKKRWGDESSRLPHDFLLILTRIQGKLVESIWNRDSEKFEGLLIDLAAVCGTVYKYLKEDRTSINNWFNS